jgi:hypothetical protein
MMHPITLAVLNFAACVHQATAIPMLYRGPPQADGTHHRYWNACGSWGEASPLENYFVRRGVPACNGSTRHQPRLIEFSSR